MEDDDATGAAGRANGAAHLPASDRPLAPPPAEIADLAAGCVRFVKQALGVELDYTPETLGVLDHYLAAAPEAGKPDVAALVVLSAGAYFGEVVRRRHGCFWHGEGHADALRIAFEGVFLAFSPFELVRQALEFFTREGPSSQMLSQADATDDLGVLELEEEDRVAVAERLADLPAVREDEFYALTTRLEVVDIASEAIRARRMAAGELAEAHFGPRDYA